MTDSLPMLPRDLGHGLVLRRMRSGDADALDEMLCRVFSETQQGVPDVVAGRWARDLVRGDHPRVRPENGYVVIDSAGDRIASTCFVIPQDWTIGGIPLTVWRPELIGTDPAYRGLNLVERIFEHVHAEAASVSVDLLAITGIPWYYRRFGYEPAIVTDTSMSISAEAARALGRPGGDRYSFREATPQDVPFIALMYRQAAARAFISATWDKRDWHYELFERTYQGTGNDAMCGGGIEPQETSTAYLLFDVPKRSHFSFVDLYNGDSKGGDNLGNTRLRMHLDGFPGA